MSLFAALIISTLFLPGPLADEPRCPNCLTATLEPLVLDPPAIQKFLQQEGVRAKIL